MAGHVVVAALLSGFINVLFDRMATQDFLNFFQGKKVLAKLLDELKIRLRSASKLLKDAEIKQLTDEDVKSWLDDLKQILYEADHVMDKINTEALRRKVETGDTQSGSKASKFLNSVSTFFSAFESTVKVEIDEILRRLKLLLDQNDVLGLKEADQQILSQRLTAPLVEESDVYGRAKDKEAIIKLLLSSDVESPKLSVIAIVGMGGLGKTTLAQLVYNDSKVRKHFDLIEWVTISEVFNVFEVTEELFKKTTGSEPGIKDLYQLQDGLKKFLMEKKFLYVLDDVWNEDYQRWELLQTPLRYGRPGSKIIVTTRSTNVVSTMHDVRTHNLLTISDDDCLQLFKKHVFDGTNLDAVSNFQEIGIQIVKRCRGLPLAVKCIAGILRSTQPEEWRSILQSDIWELQFQEKLNHKIFPALWLSYHFLPAQLKRCFTYFSIFPKDYAFKESEIENIIWLWMAEGLLQPQEGKRVEDVGVEYIKELKARSFFQQSSWDKSTLVMHDLVHDLAISMSGEFYAPANGCNDSCKLTNKTYHLSYQKKCTDVMEFDGLSEVKCLRTFLALPLSRKYIPLESKFAQNDLHQLLPSAGGSLRTLSLSQSSFTKLPDSIGYSKHLRYLDFSFTKVEELPSSTCTLYNLQTLLLSCCKNLKHLPINMSNLISLRHLAISDTPLKEMPPQMYKLRNLQTLSDFVLGENGGSRIKELGELQHLSGSLCISGLENVKDVRDVMEANLKSKEHLTKLILKWDYGHRTDDSTREREVLDALKPHWKLKELKIDGYGGTIFPDWVAHHSFGDMVEVFLSNCENCCLLPPLGQLPSLRELHIGGLKGVESIGDEFHGTSLTKPFPSLEFLKFCDLDSLEKWSFTGAEQEGELFPRLEFIYVRFCHKLNVGLPAGSFPSLETIEIEECEGMVSVVPTSQGEIDSAYPSLKLINLCKCPRMESFSGMGFPSNLKELRIEACSKLFANRKRWDLQRLSSLRRLRLIACEFEVAVGSFPEEGLLPSTLTCLTIWLFGNLKTLNGKGLQHLTSLQELNICGGKELECLPEEGLPLSLTHLDIDDCPLLEERCQRGTGEDWPKIQHIPNIHIDSKKI